MRSGRAIQWSEWLNSQMETKGVSNKILSTAAGISEGHTSKLRNGKQKPSKQVALKIANCLEADYRLMPSVGNKDEEQEMESVRIVDHEIPDHALLMADTCKSIFAEQDIYLDNYSPAERTVVYPSVCYDCVDDAIYANKAALVCGPKSFFGERNGVKPVEYNTHSYKGYSMICRAGLQIDPVFDCINEDLPSKFRSLLEIMSDSKFWRGNSSEDRIGCMGLEEVRFIRSIEGLKNEILDGVEFKIDDLDSCEFGLKKTTGKMLDRLDQPGARGYDVIVGDAMCLSRGIYDEAYKIIFTLGDMKRLIKYVGGTPYTIWIPALKNTYSTVCPNKAIEKFYDKWTTITNQLEMQVYWFLYMPDSWGKKRKFDTQKKVSEAIKNIGRQIVASNSIRNRIIREVHGHICAVHGETCDIASFSKAWDSAYIGI